MPVKRILLVLALLVTALVLSGCAAARGDSSGALTVLVEEGEHYSLEVHSVTVEPGGSASFYIETEQDYAVTATDYRGDYTLTETRGLTKLVLSDVRYPCRVHLTLSRTMRTIRYMANGGESLTGEGREIVRSYDVSVHIRPNTSIGTDLFAREGYTLTGWNTEPDGSGRRVGLGSRVSVDEPLTLYAQWAEWTEEEAFQRRIEDGGAVITAYHGTQPVLVVPETLDGCPVTQIASGAFAGCPAETVILPKSLARIEKNAFDGAALRELCFFDNIEYITDECFSGCGNLSTLRISAVEDPYGYSWRRESVWADKLDLLIETQGQERLIFYGGCAMWYNLIGADARAMVGERYTVLNMGLNGIASSLMQMELLRCFMTERDVLIHAPEISSSQQLLLNTGLGKNDDKLWCALEYDYDLVSLVDIRVFDGGVLESLRLYLDKKQPGGSYLDVYHDSNGYTFLDETGGIPFVRTGSFDSLTDSISLDPAYLEDLSRLEREYRTFREKGIPICVTYACIDIDAVPAEEQGNLTRMGELYREKFSAMEGVTVVGSIEDFVYHDGDFYDTVYHLLTEPARRCTAVWIRGLTARLASDGLPDAEQSLPGDSQEN